MLSEHYSSNLILYVVCMYIVHYVQGVLCGEALLSFHLSFSNSESGFALYLTLFRIN